MNCWLATIHEEHCPFRNIRCFLSSRKSFMRRSNLPDIPFDINLKMRLRAKPYETPLICQGTYLKFHVPHQVTYMFHGYLIRVN